VHARHGGTTAGDIDLRVFVNDREVGVPLRCASADGLSFDRELGKLSTGDAIYVAVGPNGGNWADTFDLDFSVAR